MIGPISTMRPRYMTATAIGGRPARPPPGRARRTGRRGGLVLQIHQQVDDLRLDRHVEPRRPARRRGPAPGWRSARARAMPMRWRWPPENSCGKRLPINSGRSPTRFPNRSRRRGRATRRPLADAVDRQRLADDLAGKYRHARVQRGVGVLKYDHLHLPAHRPQHALGIVAGDVLAVANLGCGRRSAVPAI